MTIAIHSLKRMIVGFHLLPQSEQDNFLQSIQPRTKLIRSFTRKSTSLIYCIQVYSLRHIYLQNQAHARDIQQVLRQHPEYPS